MDKKESILNDLINHVKKSPILNSLKEKVDQVAIQTANLKHDPISLDRLVQGLSNDTDKEILNIIRSENLNFIGGELIVLSQTTKSNIFCLNLKLYFQNNNDEIILKEKNKELDFDILDENSKNELIEKKSITYEVTAPNQE